MKPTVLVVGAGPAGLSMAVMLQQRNIQFVLVDRSGLGGGAYRKMYPGMRLASPSKYTSLPGFPNHWQEEYITAGNYQKYLEQYVLNFKLRIKKAHVEKIHFQNQNFRVIFREENHEHIFSHVVLATGMFDFPIWPVGIDQKKTSISWFHAKDWQGPESMRGMKVLIIGSATSAVEIAESLASEGIHVVVSAKNKKLKYLPQRFLGKDIHDFLVPLTKLPAIFLSHYCKSTETDPATYTSLKNYIKTGAIKVVSELISLEDDRFRFKCGTEGTFDQVIVATGYDFQYPMLQENSPEQVQKALKNRWPGLFVLGKGCVLGKPSQFLWGIAHDAPKIANQIKKRIDRMTEQRAET